MTTKALMQTSFVPKLTRYSFRFHRELNKKKEKEKKEATMGNFLRKEHGATVQHHVVNMLTRNTSHQSHPLGLK